MTSTMNRFIATFLALFLTLPIPCPSAYALREEQEDKARTALANALGAPPAPPTQTGLEEARPRVPRFTREELEAWAAHVPDAHRDLYGWVNTLPAKERGKVLETVSRAYRSFGQHMHWVERVLPRDRRAARASAHLKRDRTWVTQEDLKVQRVFNQLVRREFPGMAVIGEEASVAGADSHWRAIRDPIDGTRAYRMKPGRKDAQRYFSTFTLLHDTHPVLTIAVAPEYRLPGSKESGLWLVAGVGIHGVLVNGELTLPASERPLAETVGGINDYTHTRPYNPLYRKILQEGAKHSVTSRVSVAMFEVIGSELFPRLPGIYLTGPEPFWDALPPWHLTLAAGGEVRTLEDEKPFRLTPSLVSQGADALVPVRVQGISDRAVQELVREYRRRTGLEERWDRDPEAKRILERYPDPARRPEILYGPEEPRESDRDHVGRVLRNLQLLVEGESGWDLEEKRLLKISGALHDAGTIVHGGVEDVMRILNLAKEKIKGPAGQSVPFRTRDLIDHYGLSWTDAGRLNDLIRRDMGESSSDGLLNDLLRDDEHAIEVLNDLVQTGRIQFRNEADRQVVEAVVRSTIWAGLLTTQPAYTSTLEPGVVERALRLSEFLEAADVIDAATSFARLTFYWNRPRDLSNLILSLQTKVNENAISSQMMEKALALLNRHDPRHDRFMAILSEARHIGSHGQAWSLKDRVILDRIEAGVSLPDLVALTSAGLEEATGVGSALQEERRGASALSTAN
ncbi:MAG: hypothetical protein HYZ90_03100 [Candidatus Omnitrophica bacterium]|nr:hypothetical protein [Candidatus Omnitrophota bacterium]